MTYGLDIQAEGIEDKVIFRLDGRIDAKTSPFLEKKLQTMFQENRYRILLDFSRVDYMSSAALRLLLSATKKVKANKGSLVLFSLIDDVMDIIRIAGFEKVLTICSTEQQAMQKS